MFAEAVRQSSPCFDYVDFLAECAGHAILPMLKIKGQALARVRLHLKIPGWFHNQKSRTKVHFSIGYTLSKRNQ